MVPVVGADHAPITASATEAYMSPQISALVSGLMPVPKQSDSAGGQGLETPPTVSDHTVLTAVVVNY